ncbi:flagellar type III secretion system pore protein FliP [Halanaerobaculum tunisiense]
MTRSNQLIGVLIIVILLVAQGSALAAPQLEIPNINLEIGAGGSQPQDLAVSLQILFLLTVLTVAPAILILLTSFTRIVIVLSILKRAIGTRKMPPSQVMVGLAIFLTIFIMAPIGQDINENALQPYLAEEIEQSTALEQAVQPLREFMFEQTREKDIALFVNLSPVEQPNNHQDLAIHILIPAFVISELKTAFQIGFMIYLPFIVIDMIVASTLMSMGMMMLPPVMISLPFKILLFVLVDGWYLVIKSLVETF